MFRWPEPPLIVLVPSESLHDASPGPPEPSLQPNVVLTDWPRMYVPPEAGAEIDAVGAGGGAGVAMTVNGALGCDLDPAWFAAVTVQAYWPGEFATIEFDVAPGIAAPFHVQRSVKLCGA